MVKNYRPGSSPGRPREISRGVSVMLVIAGVVIIVFAVKFATDISRYEPIIPPAPEVRAYWTTSDHDQSVGMGANSPRAISAALPEIEAWINVFCFTTGDVGVAVRFDRPHSVRREHWRSVRLRAAFDGGRRRTIKAVFAGDDVIAVVDWGVFLRRLQSADKATITFPWEQAGDVDFTFTLRGSSRAISDAGCSF